MIDERMKEKIKGEIEVQIKKWCEAKRRIMELEVEMDELKSVESECTRWLYQDRPREFAETVLDLVKQNKAQLEKEGFTVCYDLIENIEIFYLADYDIFIEESKKHMSLEEKSRFDLEDIKELMEEN